MQNIFHQYVHKLNTLVLMATGTIIAMTMFAWAFQSGQQLLKQNVPLVDMVMQVRVDTVQLHQLIQEGGEAEHGTLDKEYVLGLMKNIHNNIDSLSMGHLQMGGISESLSEDDNLKAYLQELQSNVNVLFAYFDKNYDHISQNLEDDFTHDELFAGLDATVKEVDEYVHGAIENAVNQQYLKFVILFLVGIGFIAVLFYLLRRSEQQKAAILNQATMLAQALEHSGEAAIIASTDGIIEFVNEAFCQMTGLVYR